MKTILIPLIISTIAGFGTILGSFLAFVPGINKKTSMSLILAFSGSIMILISILDLLPSSVFTVLNHYTPLRALLLIFFSFFLGVFLIHLIDRKIKGESSLYKIGILSLFSLMLHNFPEGIATFMSSLYNPALGIKLSIAIMFHNIPEGICIAVPLSESTKSKKRGVGAAFFSSLAEPLGALTAYIFLKNYINDITISVILIFVAGIMITLSINTIYKESLKLDCKKSFVVGVLLSVIYIIVTLTI